MELPGAGGVHHHRTKLTQISRRRLLAMIGTAAGSSAMYQAMTSLGLAAESTYQGPDPARG